MDSFKVDGKIDWEAYRKAQIEAGEICYQCGSLDNLIFSPGYKKLCHQCESISKSRELSHDKMVRCPACGHSWKVGDNDDYDLYEDGEHEVSCSNCNHDFQVTTHVSYRFESPERVTEPKDE